MTLVAGVLGTVGGFLVAYQSSSGTCPEQTHTPNSLRR
jgi:hypothetical protein